MNWPQRSTIKNSGHCRKDLQMLVRMWKTTYTLWSGSGLKKRLPRVPGEPNDPGSTSTHLPLRNLAVCNKAKAWVCQNCSKNSRYLHNTQVSEYCSAPPNEFESRETPATTVIQFSQQLALGASGTKLTSMNNHRCHTCAKTDISKIPLLSRWSWLLLARLPAPLPPCCS